MTSDVVAWRPKSPFNPRWALACRGRSTRAGRRFGASPLPGNSRRPEKTTPANGGRLTMNRLPIRLALFAERQELLDADPFCLALKVHHDAVAKHRQGDGAHVIDVGYGASVHRGLRLRA